MKTYKTPEKQRKYCLAYYYAHREELLTYGLAYRRANGIKPRKAAMTEEERLAKPLPCCKCQRLITTRSMLLRRSNVCLRCRRTPVQRQKNIKSYRRSMRKRLAAYRDVRSCMDCGRKKGLEFHHRDPSTKKDNVARMVSRYGWPSVLKEIEKCDLLCKRCHERRHLTPTESAA